MKSILREELASWLVVNNIKHTAGDGFLKILKKHGVDDLPCSARSTLLKTDKHVQVEMRSGIDYVFLGVENMLKKNLEVTQLLHR
jgi:hypothetical protein